MTSAGRDLELWSASLLSKWGFEDGGVPDQVYDLLFDELGYTPGRDTRFPWQAVLTELVRDHLLSALDQRVRLDRWTLPQLHNPLRAGWVDGVPVPAGVHNAVDPSELGWTVVLTPDHVIVPWAVVAERCTAWLDQPCPASVYEIISDGEVAR